MNVTLLDDVCMFACLKVFEGVWSSGSLLQDLRKQDLEADMISFCTALGACRTGHWHVALPFSKGLRDQLLELLELLDFS